MGNFIWNGLVHSVHRFILAMMGIGFCFTLPVSAQHTPSTLRPDTILLEPIQVVDRGHKTLTIGQYTWHLDSTLQQQLGGQSLGDLLPILPVQVRSYGNGMLGSLSIRGTGPAHSVVNWNGLTLNSPMLGQQDLSLVPAIAYNRLQLQTGSLSSIIGADAVSGAILLKSVPDWPTKLTGFFQGELGQFGRYTATGRLSYPLGKGNKPVWSGQTGAHWGVLRNNFLFRNTARPGLPTEKQTNAGTSQQAITQSIYARLAGGIYVALHGWWQKNDRLLQPAIGVQQTGEQQLDRSLRLTGQVSGRVKKADWFIQLGYLADRLIYINPVFKLQEPSEARQWIARTEWVKSVQFLSTPWSLRLGADLLTATALTTAYVQVRSQSRVDGYVSLTGQPLKSLHVLIQLRQGRATGYSPPLLPTLGLTYDLLKKGSSLVQSRFHVSRTYRVPTLNDRFWQPGGNEFLRPETGWTQEGGVTYTQAQDNRRIMISVTGFSTRMTDWIQWRPSISGTYWSPQNLLTVSSRGLEMDANYSLRVAGWQVNNRLSGTYVRVTDLSTEPATRQRQLPYAPTVLATVSESATKGRWRGGIQGTFTGHQAIRSDHSAFLPAYFLLQAQLAYTCFQNRSLTVAVLGNNLTNATYQTLENRAMPGINTRLQLNYLLH